MRIDDRVLKVAKHWGLDPALIQAMVNAEGGMDHIVKAVQCSLPAVDTVEEALEVTARSATHRLWEYVKLYHAWPFVEFLAEKWAPVNAENDPTHLNEHWPVNVINFWVQRR